MRSRRGSTSGKSKIDDEADKITGAVQPDLSPTPEAALALNGRRGFAPSQEPTPSPLRRITRSMTPERVGSQELSPLAGLTGLLDNGLTAPAGGSRKSRRSTLNRFADQQNKWGFVPGEEDTMLLEMNMPGRLQVYEASLPIGVGCSSML